MSRYKAASDNAEKIEDELKAEKRKLQREVGASLWLFLFVCSRRFNPTPVSSQLRTALDKIEEMEMTNQHLVKRLEKMKANRNALLSQQ